MTKKVLFAAYGMLLDPYVMLSLCPNAVKFEADSPKLLEYRLEIYNHATVVPAITDYVPVGLWEINEADLEFLDMFEGVPGGYYTRETRRIFFLNVDGNSDSVMAQIYIMNPDRHGDMPVTNSKEYENYLRAGYKYFGLDQYKLSLAVYKPVPEPVPFVFY